MQLGNIKHEHCCLYCGRIGNSKWGKPIIKFCCRECKNKYYEVPENKKLLRDRKRIMRIKNKIRRNGNKKIIRRSKVT